MSANMCKWQLYGFSNSRLRSSVFKEVSRFFALPTWISSTSLQQTCIWYFNGALNQTCTKFRTRIKKHVNFAILYLVCILDFKRWQMCLLVPAHLFTPVCISLCVYTNTFDVYIMQIVCVYLYVYTPHKTVCMCMCVCVYVYMMCMHGCINVWMYVQMITNVWIYGHMVENM